MKSLDADKKASKTSEAAPAVAEKAAEKVDFSNVKIEPIFEEMVDDRIPAVNFCKTVNQILEENIMDKNYKPITSMKEVPEQLGKLRRQYLRYQQAEIIYSISHKKLFELASDAGAIYRIDGTVLINRDIFDDYLERFHEPATRKGKEEMADER